MAAPIKIKLDTSKYLAPTEYEITEAKQYVLQREEYTQLLEKRIDEKLADAAERILIICYAHNIDPERFTISSSYNEQMMDEISEVMNELEQALLDLIYEYSTRCTNKQARMSLLTAWMATLGRGNNNLQNTLDNYLYKAMKDWEAAIAALVAANVQQAAAVTRIKTYLHSIYTMPEVLSAFKNPTNFSATYILSRGVQKGAVGISNNGSTNLTNMGKTTLQMAWMRSLMLDYEEDEDVEGYYVFRGSNYDCPLCDSHCGFHLMTDTSHFPPFHGRCCCGSVAVYSKDSKT